MTLKKKFLLLSGATALLIVAMFAANRYARKKRVTELATICHAIADKRTVQEVEQAIFDQNLGVGRIQINNLNPFTGELIWGMVIKPSGEAKGNLGPFEITRYDFNWIQIIEDSKTKKVLNFVMVMTKGDRINLTIGNNKIQPWKRGDYLSTSEECEIYAEYE